MTNKIILRDARCSEHGAMNKVSPTMWRCLVCHIGFDEETGTFLASSLDGFKKKIDDQEKKAIFIGEEGRGMSWNSLHMTKAIKDVIDGDKEEIK